MRFVLDKAIPGATCSAAHLIRSQNDSKGSLCSAIGSHGIRVSERGSVTGVMNVRVQSFLLLIPPKDNKCSA